MYTFLLNFGTIFGLIIHVRSLFHESIHTRLLESEQVVQASNLDRAGIIAPVDRHLLQQEHLDTWRDLRTIEEVVKKNKYTVVFGKTLGNVAKGILSNLNLLPEEIDTIRRSAAIWAKDKKKKTLAIAVYYLAEVLKHHLPGTTDEETQSLAQRLIATYKFPPNSNDRDNDRRVAREVVTPFLDSVMSELSLHLLLEKFSKTKGETIGLSSSSGGKLDWKQMITKEDQLQYSKYYQAYMRLIEIFDKLAAAGAQDRNLIFKNFTPSLERSQRGTIYLLHKKATNPIQMHRYLINRPPYPTNKPLTLPLFGYPDKINGKSSAQLEINIHKTWSQSGEQDLEISSRLLELSNKIANTCEKLPSKVYTMEGYVALLETAQAGSVRDREMLNHISRTIKLVVDLEEDESEEQQVLWFILQSALRSLPMRSEHRQSEKRIENSVMFYLFIRRISTVLDTVTKTDSSSNITKDKGMKAKFMMYYWSLVSFVTSGIRKTNAVEWMELGLGRVYLNHLKSSVTLNKLHGQMTLVAEKGKTPHLSNSIWLDESDMISDEPEAALFNSKMKPAKKYVRNPDRGTKRYNSSKQPKLFKSKKKTLEGPRRNPPRHTRTYVFPEDEEHYETIPSTQFKETIQEKESNKNIQEMLNFRIPKRKATRYSNTPGEDEASGKQSENTSDQGMGHAMQEARDLLVPFKKRPRTTTYKIVLPDIPVGFVSRENRHDNAPKFDQIQTSKDHQNEAVQKGQGSQDFIQTTGSEPESSDPLSPIIPGQTKHVPQRDQENHHINLNDLMEEDLSVLDHNNAQEPLSSNNNFNKAVPSLSKIGAASFSQANTCSELWVLVSVLHLPVLNFYLAGIG
ncbi:uncharacterized protein MELLADRAFT_112781 [Melampsora larici-populina 98AG31]|uniref:Uncharacterized protein n=1 Tax=Melampsora larici-populina (strain 98AG31 / pathotype 3-4-7) TaxID=747676 RepID=F4S7K5_MELLP|nr:uncharacterized protein MELLADRAFT_112781 [Melampsora larici-populina 98AG31]EGF99334.1 hypothetical protein MELLADRAFT_112781 [Melampsora larici-populina 98AG31]